MRFWRLIPSALVAALVLAITPQSAQAITYAAWIASYGLTGTDAAESANPSHDGIPNLLKYALDAGSPLINAGPISNFVSSGFAVRTGDAIGAWDWVPASRKNYSPTGIFHASLRWRPRPGVEGIRYQPELCTELTAGGWYSGRSAILNESMPGNIVQSTALMQSQPFRMYFMRLRIIEDAAVGNSLAGITAAGISAQALDVGTPLAQLRPATAYTSTTFTSADTIVTRETTSSFLTDYSWSWAPRVSNLSPVTLVRTSSNPAVIVPTEGDATTWTAVGPGTATLSLTTGSNTYSAAVAVTLQAAGTVDTVTGFVAGSLRAHLVSQIDPLLVGKTAAASLGIFTTQDHATPAYVRNPACWAAPYVAALTAISPWNSQGGTQFAGILISPRHVLFATHYAAGVGAVMRFVAADGTVVERTITARQSLTVTSSYYPDLTIGLLDSDVPSSIAYARVLPTTWPTYLPSMATTPKRVPSLGLDAEEKALVSDLSALTTMAQMATPTDSGRRAFYEDKIGGDSSNPACLIINGQLVVLTCWTFGGAGQGTFVTDQHAALNALMTSLGGGYTLTDADLSSFTAY